MLLHLTHVADIFLVCHLLFFFLTWFMEFFFFLHLEYFPFTCQIKEYFLSEFLS